MKYYIYNNPDNSLSIIMPCINVEDGPDFTEEQALARAFKDIPPYATNVRTIKASDLPQDRTFRNAWKQDSGVVSHDMDKAKDITKNILRQIRTSKLQKLDTDYMIADESGDIQTKKLIATKKQELRDITKHPDLDNANTIHELKNLIQILESK